jgi:hypothetical protein
MCEKYGARCDVTVSHCQSSSLFHAMTAAWSRAAAIASGGMWGAPEVWYRTAS